MGEVKTAEPYSSQSKGQDKRQWHRKKTLEIPLKHKKNTVHNTGGHPQEQVDQRYGIVSITGGIQNPTGHDPQQTALTDPVLSRGLNQNISSRGPLVI